MTEFGFDRDFIPRQFRNPTKQYEKRQPAVIGRINFSRMRRARAIDPRDPYPFRERSGNELSQTAKRLSPAAKLAQECVPALPLFFLSFSPLIFAKPRSK